MTELLPRSDTEEEEAPRDRKTTGIHIAAACAHATQTVVSVALIVQAFEGQGWWRVLLTQYNGIQQWQRYRLLWAIPAFFAVSAITEFLHSKCPYPKRLTTHQTKGSENMMKLIQRRWTEYSISAGIMLWVIGTLSGIYEFSSLLMLVLTNVCLQYTGYRAEVTVLRIQGSKQEAQHILYVGWVIFAMQWVVIFVYFFLALEDSTDHVPDMVYAIAPTLFVLFSLFGLPVHIWIRSGPTPGSNYYKRVDVWYTVLSLTAKTTLGWMVLGGTLRDSPVPE